MEFVGNIIDYLGYAMVLAGMFRGLGTLFTRFILFSQAINRGSLG